MPEILIRISAKIRKIQKFIETLEHLHIGIHIDTAIMIESIEADIVGCKGILLTLKGLTNPLGAVQVKAIGIPKHDFVIGQNIFPSLEALGNLSRISITTEPTKMDNFGYHIVIIYKCSITCFIWFFHERCSTDVLMS